MRKSHKKSHVAPFILDQCRAANCTAIRNQKLTQLCHYLGSNFLILYLQPDSHKLITGLVPCGRYQFLKVTYQPVQKILIWLDSILILRLMLLMSQGAMISFLIITSWDVILKAERGWRVVTNEFIRSHTYGLQFIRNKLFRKSRVLKLPHTVNIIANESIAIISSVKLAS